MRHAILPLLFSLALLVSSPWAHTQSPDDDLAREAAAALSAFGYDVDLSRVTVERASRKQINEDLRASAWERLPLPKLESLLAWLHGMGFWGIGTFEDLSEQLAKTDTLAGAYYVPTREALVLLDSPDIPMAGPDGTRYVLAHELVHAWRDQESDLKGLFTDDTRTSEEANVWACLVEGEAQFAMLALHRQDEGLGIEGLSPKDFEGIAARLFGSERLTFPYDLGGQLAWLRWQQGGWGAVHELWDERPSSTEQIMHIEKLGQDLPQDVQLPAWPAHLPPAELLASDCLGEMEIYLWMRMLALAPDEARIAAGGWDGDRLQHYRTESGESAMIWRTVWDRDVDALQFYETLALAGDGEWRIDGRVVDWVRTVDGALAGELMKSLAGSPQALEAGAGDAASTAALEAAWSKELGLVPFISDGRWVRPVGGFSLPVPEGWYQDGSDPRAVLLSEDGWSDGAWIFVTLVPNGGEMTIEDLQDELRVPIEGEGVTPEALGLHEIEGRAVIRWSQVRGDSDSEDPVWSAALVSGDVSVFITATCDSKHQTEFSETITGILDGLSFDLEGLARPHETSDNDEQPSPAPSQYFTLHVVDQWNGEPCADQDVWIVAAEAMRARDGVPVGKDPEWRRGRRFRTNARGEVRVPFRSSVQEIYARDGESRSIAQVRALPSGDETLRMKIDGPHVTRTLVVKVVDQEGNPRSDVPVGILRRGPSSASMREEKTTRSRSGEATWKDVFRKLGSYGRDREFYVTFAFPVSDPPLVRIRPGDSLQEPVTLVLPPTGSLRIHIDPDPVMRDGSVGSKLAPSNPSAHSIGIQNSMDPDSVRFEEAQTDSGRRGSDEGVLYPFVGLGLELDISCFGLETERVLGPTVANERVEITLGSTPVEEPPEQPIPTGKPTLGGRCLDESSAPVADQWLRWTLQWGPGESNRLQGRVKTDKKGNFEIEDPSPEGVHGVSSFRLERESGGGIGGSRWRASIPVPLPGQFQLGDLKPFGSR